MGKKKGGHRRKSKASLLQIGEGILILYGGAKTIAMANMQADFYGGVSGYVRNLRTPAGGAPGKGPILGTELAKTLAPLAESGLVVLGVEGVKFIAEELPGGAKGIRAIHNVRVKGHPVL